MIFVIIDNVQCEVTNMFDAEGNEIDDFDLASTAVVRDPDDCWLTIDVADFQPVTVH